MKKVDEQKPLAYRLAAVQEAYELASHEKNIAGQTESMRREGALYFESDSLDHALILFRQLVKLAEEANDRTSLGVAFNNIGLILSEHSVYDSAIVYYEKADKIFKETSDSARLSQCYINLGIAYKNIGSFEKAFSTSLEAAQIMKAMGDSAELGSVYSTLGNTMKDLRRPAEALAYHREAINMRTQLHDSIGIAGSLNNIGNVYKSEGQYENALSYYLQSLQLKKNLGSKRSRVTSIDNIAETYLDLMNYDIAEKYESEAIALRDKANDLDGWMTSAVRLARIYLALKEPAKAETLALEISAAAQKPNYIRQHLDGSLLLKDIYLLEKRYDQAAVQANTALALQDSLFNSDLSAAISRMNVRFQTEEQKKRLELAQKNAIIQDQQIGIQKKFILLLGGVVFLLLVITYLLYNSNRLRKKARERTELLMSELNHRVKNNIQIMSSVLNLQRATVNTPEEVKIIETARNRVQSIGVIHNLLYQKEYTGSIDMHVLISELAANISHALKSGNSNLETRLFVDKLYLSTRQAIPVGLVINELVTNIYKYGHAQEDVLTITIRMASENEKCNLCVKDNGQAWHDQVEQPEKSGLGLRLITMLCRQLKAEVRSGRENEENYYLINFNIIP